MDPEPIATPPSQGPPPPTWLTSAWSELPLAQKDWKTSLAPAYIGLFLWVAFYDQMPAAMLARCGLATAVLCVGLAGTLAYVMFYYAPAVWGCATRRTLSVLSTSTFGTTGALCVTGLVLGLSQVVGFAVATSYGTGLCLLGLAHLGLIDGASLAPAEFAVVRGMPTLFVVTALVWSLWVGLVGRYLVRVIAALMNVFPLVSALILGAAAVAAFQGLPAGRDALFFAGESAGRTHSQASAVFTAMNWILAFFAVSGVASADWGSACKTPRDVRLGGLVSVGFASWIVGTLALLTAAGTIGRFGTDLGSEAGLPFPGRTFHATLTPLFGAKAGGAMLLALGLASLAPGVFAASFFATRFHELRPRLGRTAWSMLGVVAAWPLILSGRAFQLGAVYAFTGAVVAPAFGAIAADYCRSPSGWRGARRGVNPPGALGWLIGAGVGLLSVIVSKSPTPSVLWAFLVGFVTFYILSVIGLEAPIDARLDPAARREAAEFRA